MNSIYLFENIPLYIIGIQTTSSIITLQPIINNAGKSTMQSIFKSSWIIYDHDGSWTYVSLGNHFSLYYILL